VPSPRHPLKRRLLFALGLVAPAALAQGDGVSPYRAGMAALDAGDAAAAARLLIQAVGADAPASAWFDLALARQDLRDFAGAETAYTEVLARKPDHAEAAVNLGVVRQEAGDLDGAMEAYAQAYRLRPQTFGTIAMALTSGSHGRLWLDEDALRKSLGG
jgi:tetratricopeptide (TPR) repeat protein